MAENLSNDKFLQQNHIQIQRSSFLANHFARKQFALRDSYNPRDPYGSRLSHYWQPGDTKWTVIWKRIVNNLTYMFNPDTYSKQSLQQLKGAMIKNKIEIIELMLVIGIPILIIYPILRPRLQRVKRQFLFQYYLQSQMLARKLQTKNVKLPIHEVQQIIKRAEQKIKL